MTTKKSEVESTRSTAATAASFHPASSGWRCACRMFPGFAALPTPVLVSLEPYAPLVDPAAGPLEAADREAIAATVVGIVAGRPFAGAPAGGASARAVALAGFTSRVVGGAGDLDRGDLERLVRSGFTAEEVHAVAEAAIGFHVVARLAHAAGGRRAIAKASAGVDPVAAMGGARGGEPVRAA